MLVTYNVGFRGAVGWQSSGEVEYFGRKGRREYPAVVRAHANNYGWLPRVLSLYSSLIANRKPLTMLAV